MSLNGHSFCYMNFFNFTSFVENREDIFDLNATYFMKGLILGRLEMKVTSLD